MPSPGATDPEIRSATRPAAATPQSLIAEILPFLRKRGFEAGDRLPSERELAERFSVSRLKPSGLSSGGRNRAFFCAVPPATQASMHWCSNPVWAFR